MSSKKYREVRGKYVGGKSRWFYLFRGVFCSVLITVPCILILSIILMFTNFSEKYISAPVLVSVPLCVVFSSFLSTLGSKNTGWINGTLTALIYAFVVFVVRSVIIGGVIFDLSSVIMLLGFVFIGTIGGIAGILLTEIIGKR
jgi:putative membrane protein (TIGR04086 family)